MVVLTLLPLLFLLVDASKRSHHLALASRHVAASLSGERNLADTTDSLSLEPPFNVNYLSFKNATTLRGDQPLLIGFNLPVIALGSDILEQADVPRNKRPLSISSNAAHGAVKGKGRWITTSMYRFEPYNDWPPDIVLDIQINEDITSASGQNLQRNALFKSFPIHLSTRPLTFVVEAVNSAAAKNLTSGNWRSVSSWGGKKCHEVPPDGKIEGRFSSLIDERVVRGGENLLIVEDITSSGDSSKVSARITLKKCDATTRRPIPLSVIRPRRHTTCATISFNAQPHRTYRVRLAVGVTYSLESGPTQPQTKDDPCLTGLRPFQIQGNDKEANIEYKRFRIFLQHGISRATSVAAFSKQLSIVSQDTETEIPLSSVEHDKAASALRIRADGLEGGRKYRLVIRGSEEVKDGFEQPLQDSQIPFTLVKPSSTCMYPGVNRMSTVYALRSVEAANMCQGVEKEDLCLYDKTTQSLLFPIFLRPPGPDQRQDSKKRLHVKAWTVDDVLSFEEALGKALDPNKQGNVWETSGSEKPPFEDSTIFKQVISSDGFSVGEIHLPLNTTSGLHLVDVASLDQMRRFSSIEQKYILLSSNDRHVINHFLRVSPVPRDVADPAAPVHMMAELTVYVSPTGSDMSSLENFRVKVWQADRMKSVSPSKVGSSVLSSRVQEITAGRVVTTDPGGRAEMRVDLAEIIRAERRKLDDLLAAEGFSVEKDPGSARWKYRTADWIVQVISPTGQSLLSQSFVSPVTVDAVVDTAYYQDRLHDKQIEFDCEPLVKGYQQCGRAVQLPSGQRVRFTDIVAQWSTDRAIAAPDQKLGIVGAVSATAADFQLPENSAQVASVAANITSLSDLVGPDVQAIALLNLVFRRQAPEGGSGGSPSASCLLSSAVVNPLGSFATELRIPKTTASGPLTHDCFAVLLVASDVSESDIVAYLTRVEDAMAKDNRLCTDKEEFRKTVAAYLPASKYYGILVPDNVNAVTRRALVIGDPRAPTFEFKTTAPLIVKHRSEFVYRVSVTSYTLASGSHQRVSTTLTVPAEPVVGTERPSSERRDLTVVGYRHAVCDEDSRNCKLTTEAETDSDGVAKFSVDLECLGRVLNASGLKFSRVTEPLLLTIDASMNGLTGEVLRSQAKVIVDDAGYTLSEPYTPYYAPQYKMRGAIVALKSALRALDEKLSARVDDSQVDYTIFKVTRAKEYKDKDGEAFVYGWHECSDYIEVPGTGATYDEAKIMSSLKRDKGFRAIGVVGHCTAKNTQDQPFQCGALLDPSSRDDHLVVSRMVVRSAVDDRTPVSIYACSVITAPGNEAAARISIPLARTAIARIDNDSAVEVSFLNPFIGYLPIEDAPSEARLYFSYNVMGDGKGTSSGVVDLPVAQSFLNVERHRASKNFTGILEAANVSVVIPALPASCQKESCTLGVVVTLTPTSGTRDTEVTRSVLQSRQDILYALDYLNLPDASRENAKLSVDSARQALADALSLNFHFGFAQESEDPVPTFRPGEKVDLVITADSSDEGEAWFLIVDKAFLDLCPFDTGGPFAFPTFLAQAAKFPGSSSSVMDQPKLTAFTSLDGLGSVEVMQKIANIILRRWRHDPAASFYDWPIVPQRDGYQSDDFDLSDDEFFRRLTSDLTKFPGLMRHMARVGNMAYRTVSDDAGPYLMMASPMASEGASMMLGKSASGVGGAGDVSVTRVEGEPLVGLIKASLTPSVGEMKAKVPLIIPGKAGTFQITAVAITRDANNSLRFGEISKDFVSGKPIYLKPHVPRFVRQDDIFELGAVISVDDATLKTAAVNRQPLSFDVALRVDHGADLLGFVDKSDSQRSIVRSKRVTFESSDGHTKRCLFRVVARSEQTGTVEVVFELKSSGGGRDLDSVAASFEVIERLQMVTVGTAMILKAGISHTELMKLPRMVSGKGSLDLTVSMGFSSAIRDLALRRIESDFSSGQGWLSSNVLKSLSDADADAVEAGDLWGQGSVPIFSGGDDLDSSFAVESRALLPSPPVSLKPVSALARTFQWAPEGLQNFRVPGMTLLLALMTESLLGCRLGTAALMQESTNRSIADAAEVARAVLQFYAQPVPVARDFADNPFGFLSQPWWTLKKEDAEKALGWRRLDFRSTASAVTLLRTYVAQSGPCALPITAKFRKAAQEMANRLEKEIRSALIFEARRFVKRSEQDPPAETFMQYLGLDTYADLAYHFGFDSPVLSAASQSFGEAALSLSDFLRLRKVSSDADDVLSAADLLMTKAILDAGAMSFLSREERKAVKEFTRDRLHLLGDLLRPSGSVAYFANSREGATPASDTTQAIALSICSQYPNFTEGVPSDQLAAVATFLAQGGSLKGFFFVEGGLGSQSLSYVLEGISSYDKATNPELFRPSTDAQLRTNSPPLGLRVTAAVSDFGKSLIVLKAFFSKNKLEPVSVHKEWGELLIEGEQSLVFGVKGQGEALGSVRASFVPMMKQHYPAYKGILVQKLYQPLDPSTGKCSGKLVLYARPGDVLCVTLRLTVKDQLKEIRVVDLMLSGLEALDPNVYKDTASAVEPLSDDLTRILRPDLCSKPSVRSAEGTVTWECRGLNPGVTDLTYKAIANLPGAYAVSPAKAYARLNPEIMGLSGAAVTSFVIADGVTSLGAGLESFDVSATVPSFIDGVTESLSPSKCPSCPHGQVCDPSAGRCFDPELLLLE